MSWCFTFLADILWVPIVAYAQQLGLGSSFLGVVFAVNLGARLIPNVVVTHMGIRSEFVMMTGVFAGYAVSFARPTESWALLTMSICSGMGFVRASLTLHPRMAFSSEEQLVRASKYFGSVRNLGTITALVVPVFVFQTLGWQGVCALGMAAAMLYSAVAAVQHYLVCNKQVCKLASETTADTQASIPWIDWILGAAFVMTEMQFNLFNAAAPMALTCTFGMKVASVGKLLAGFNCISMFFLALVPSMPSCAVLHQSPLNVLTAFSTICVSWCLAVIALLFPDSGLGMFVASLLVFVLSVFFAQVLMLENLTGVLDVRDAKVLMGTSETVGGIFAMLGGYLGDELETLGAAAPFMLQTSVAMLTVVVLGAALGHRRCTQTNLTGKSGKDIGTTFTCLRECFCGLKAIVGLPGSFISLEKEYRKSLLPQHLTNPLLDLPDTERLEPRSVEAADPDCSSCSQETCGHHELPSHMLGGSTVTERPSIPCGNQTTNVLDAEPDPEDLMPICKSDRCIPSNIA